MEEEELVEAEHSDSLRLRLRFLWDRLGWAICFLLLTRTQPMKTLRQEVFPTCLLLVQALIWITGQPPALTFSFSVWSSYTRTQTSQFFNNYFSAHAVLPATSGIGTSKTFLPWWRFPWWHHPFLKGSLKGFQTPAPRLAFKALWTHLPGLACAAAPSTHSHTAGHRCLLSPSSCSQSSLSVDILCIPALSPLHPPTCQHSKLPFTA